MAEYRTPEEMNALFESCKKDLAAIGVKQGDIKSFSVEKLRAGSLGQVASYYNRKNGSIRYDVSISSVYLNKDINIDAVRGNMFHELLHATDECYKYGQDHGGAWLKWAKIVEDTYHCPVIGNSTNKVGIPEHVAIQDMFGGKRVRYVVRCDKCQSVDFFLHATKRMLELFDYGCTCGGNLSLEVIGDVPEKEAAVLREHGIGYVPYQERDLVSWSPKNKLATE